MNTLLKKDTASNPEDLGDQHMMTSMDTPLRPDAFDRTDEEKISKISQLFKDIIFYQS